MRDRSIRLRGMQRYNGQWYGRRRGIRKASDRIMLAIYPNRISHFSIQSSLHSPRLVKSICTTHLALSRRSSSRVLAARTSFSSCNLAILWEIVLSWSSTAGSVGGGPSLGMNILTDRRVDWVLDDVDGIEDWSFGGLCEAGRSKGMTS